MIATLVALVAIVAGIGGTWATSRSEQAVQAKAIAEIKVEHKEGTQMLTDEYKEGIAGAHRHTTNSVAGLKAEGCDPARSHKVTIAEIKRDLSHICTTQTQMREDQEKATERILRAIEGR